MFFRLHNFTDDFIFTQLLNIENGKGYWKTHPEHLASILKLGPIYLGDTTVKTVKQAMSILNNTSAKDAKDSLRSQLLTTILNLKNGANPKITGHDINKVVEDSISFLESHLESVKSRHHDEDNDDNHDDEDNDSNHDDRKEALALKDKLEDYNEKDDFSCPPTQLAESLTLTDLVTSTKGTAHTTTIPETLFLDDPAVDTTKGTGTGGQGGGGGPGGPGGQGGGGGGGSTSTTGPGFPGIIGPAVGGTGGGSTKFHDVTVQIGTGGKVKAANAGGSCVDTYQTIKVSSIVESLSPLKRVELRFVHEGEPLEDYTAIRMQITNMTIGENLYSVSGSIPWELMSGSYGVRYWLHALNEDLEISDSTKYLISVKPGYSILGNLEFDVVTIKAEGSTLKPIAYFTNTISKPVSGAISLIVDGKVVDTSQPQSFEPGETSVQLVWKIPRVGTVVDYQVNVIAEFCGKIFETEEVTLSTFPRTVIESIPDKINVKLFTDQLGNTVARAGSLYSSDVNPNTNFRVISPDGTCVIGDTEECLIRESTFGSRGNVESVTIDGQVYRIRYSGSENVVERFTIT